MPISAEFGNYGSGAEGFSVSEYCMFCYQNGVYTKPDQTVEEMVESSIDFMTANLGFTRDHASTLSNEVIPKLKRWKL